MSKIYGELESEKRAKDNLTCRQIVKTINDFGISENQKLMIIYLLALELEDHECMQELTTVAREFGKKSLMLVSDLASD